MTGTIPHPYSEDMAIDWIESLQEGEEGVAFAVDLGGALIGCIGYRATEKDHAEMGYWIGKPYWGLGYATEAARALILYAFAKERFDYLTVGHFKENPASARVIAKLGFEPSGEMLRDCAARNNKARCLTYRLTRERALANLRPDLEAAPSFRRGEGWGEGDFALNNLCFNPLDPAPSQNGSAGPLPKGRGGPYSRE